MLDRRTESEPEVRLRKFCTLTGHSTWHILHACPVVGLVLRLLNVPQFNWYLSEAGGTPLNLTRIHRAQLPDAPTPSINAIRAHV
eukprot:2547026-Karenia_brevis.AAC.1